MSDFNVYDMLEAEDLARTASVKHSQEVFREAIFEADERFGSYLRSSEDQQDFLARLSNVKRDFKRVVAGYLEPTPAILTSVAKAVQELRTADSSSVVWNDHGEYSTAHTMDGYQLWVGNTDADDGAESWEEGEWSLFDSSYNELASGTEVNSFQAQVAVEKAYQNLKTSSRRQASGSWKEVNPRSEGIHPDNAVWKLQGPGGISGTVIDEFKSGEDADWFIFGPNGPILNRKYGEPPVTVEEAKRLVEDHINSGTVASKRVAWSVPENFYQDAVKEIERVFRGAGWTPISSDGLDWETNVNGEEYAFFGAIGNLSFAGVDDFEYTPIKDFNIATVEDATLYAQQAVDYVNEDSDSSFFSSRKQASVLRWEPYDDMGSVYAKIPGIGAILEARADGTWNVYVDESFENTVAWGIEEDLEQAKNKCETAAYRKFGWPGEIVG